MPWPAQKQILIILLSSIGRQTFTDQITDAMRPLTTDSILAERLRAGGREIAEHQFPTQASTAKFSDFLERLISLRPGQVYSVMRIGHVELFAAAAQSDCPDHVLSCAQKLQEGSPMACRAGERGWN